MCFLRSLLLQLSSGSPDRTGTPSFYISKSLHMLAAVQRFKRRHDPHLHEVEVSVTLCKSLASTVTLETATKTTLKLNHCRVKRWQILQLRDSKMILKCFISVKYYRSLRESFQIEALVQSEPACSLRWTLGRLPAVAMFRRLRSWKLNVKRETLSDHVICN